MTKRILASLNQTFAINWRIGERINTNEVNIMDYRIYILSN